MNGVDLGVRTEDIDVLKMNRYIVGELLEKYSMNTGIAAFENSLPYDYEDRLVHFDLNTKVIDYWAISIEDAIAGKIYAWRDKDIEHLYSKEVLSKINWNKLKESVINLHDSLLNENDFAWIKLRFNIYAEACGHENLKFEDIQ